MRLNQVEFRWGELNKAHELLLHSGKGRCVVAFFIRGSEGYHMETVGERFFLDKDTWIVGKFALEFLNATFEEREGEEGRKGE